MKKTIFLSCSLGLLLLLAQNCQAQQPTAKGGDTTIASYRDTLKNYTYQNVYAIVTGINLSRGSNGMMMGGMMPSMSRINTDSLALVQKSWKGSVMLSLYSSKESYGAGKQPVGSVNVNVVLSDRPPLLSEILSKAVGILSRSKE